MNKAEWFKLLTLAGFVLGAAWLTLEMGLVMASIGGAQ